MVATMIHKDVGIGFFHLLYAQRVTRLAVLDMALSTQFYYFDKK